VTPDELSQLKEASGLFNKLLGMAERHVSRTYPNVTCKGSQGEEDSLLRDLLPGDDGVYVDIGAGEPVQCSNTWAFYQRGWRGLLVEPLFWYWPALLHQRPGDFLYDAAVRDYTGMAQLRVQGTVSSVLPAWNIAEQCDMLVPCETAADVLAKFPAIRDQCRLCSIDVEGAEGEVLRSIDWSVFHPHILCVEYRAYDPVSLGKDISGEWAGLLAEHDYREVARTSLNIIFQYDPPATEETPEEEPADEPAEVA